MQREDDSRFVKSSAVFVSVGPTTRVYRSIEEIPPLVRRRLTEAARAWDSATILIADRRGREQIARALQGLPAAVRFRFLESLKVREKKPPAASRRAVWRRWLAGLLFPAAGFAIWLAFAARW